MPLDRRAVVGLLGGVLGAGATPGGALAAGASAASRATGTRVVLLGTKGGPTPSAYRAAPATLVVAGGRPYLVDCGEGTAGQLAKAGVDLRSLGRVLVTHNHSDHVIGLGPLLVLAWASGLTTPVAVHGPPPVAEIVRRSVSAMAYDIEARIREEGAPPLDPLIHVDEIDRPGPVFRDGDVVVTCAVVDHYTVKPALAYRFDTPGRSVVISGDTTYSENLIALARGADLLIHEAMYVEAIDGLAASGGPTLRDHLLKSHTTTEQLGRIAAAAGVKKLVLSHLVPAFPSITDEMWLRGVRRHFAGETVVGRDLMEV